MSVVARRVPLVLFACVFLAGVGVFGDASASAEVVHDFQFSFGGGETPEGSFGEDLGTVAIDQASGDVYAVGFGSDAVYKFDATGKYLSETTGAAVPQKSLGFSSSNPGSGIAVDNSSGPNKGDLYVAGTENGVVYRFDSSGKLLSELNGSGTPTGSFSPSGVAVDAGGNLFVADRANDVVDEFDAAGGYVGQLANPDIIDPVTIAVDSSDNVYVTNFGNSVVKLEPGGAASVLDTDDPYAMAVDPATNNVYVFEDASPSFGRIVEFNQAGDRLGAFGEERLIKAFGIAVNGGTGEMYVAENEYGLVDVFGAGLVVPDVVTLPASNVQSSSATLNGTVNPDGIQVTGCEFEYGTSTSYGQSIPCAQSAASIGAGSGILSVNADPGSLRADTEYHYRIVVSNASGSNHGADGTFVTTGPPRIDGESASDITRTTAVLQGQVTPSGFDTTYRFEYGTSPSYGTSIPVPEADIGAQTTNQSVSQSLSNLQLGVTYHYRIVAVNSQGAVDGADHTFTTIGYIDSEYATDVTSSSATINAQINPLGSNTEYRFEYGTSTAYGHTFLGDIGEGSSDVLVSYHRQELQPGTTYHYRWVASNALGIDEGADHTFTTQLAGSELKLLDGRAWELVSPANKAGGLIGLSFNGLRAAGDGSGITYLDFGLAIGEGPVASGSPLTGSQILSVRSPGGWRSKDITLPQNALPEEGASEELTAFPANYGIFSPDLSAAVVNPGPFTPLSTGALERTPYLDDVAADSFVPLLTPANTPVGTKINTEGRYGSVHVADSTPDKSHVLISTSSLLTPEAVGGEPGGTEGPNLYEWSGGRLQLVNILPEAEGGPVNYACLAGSAECFPGGSSSPGHARAISDDGRWVAWTRNDPYGSSGELNYKGLYARDMVAGRTVRVGGAHALYQTMSSDGSRIFFLENGDLYEFETGTDTQVDLTGTHGAGEANAGVREEVSDVSEDGSYVYFVATGVLANGAVSGEDNLYLLHEGSGMWSVRYITTLSGEDGNSWYGAFNEVQPSLSDVSSRVSPDGRYLAFMSELSLTGYDNRDAVSGQPDEEVYLYDAVAERLVCASCNPTGARPVGVLDHEGGRGLQIEEGTTWGAHTSGSGDSGVHWLAGSIPTWREEDGVEQSRYLSDSGRLFFDSPDALVPQDTNGLEDVYEYEPVGTGGVSGCTEASLTFSQRSAGCVDLISSGTSASESVFLDASETGDDVFFITAGKLVPEDYDAAYDVYDAHVCSVTVPCVTMPVSSPPCTSGDSCKAAPSPQPEIFGPTPSATFSGVGNVTTTSGTVVKAKSLTRAQKLASALRACRKKGRSKRAVCERRVRRRYGVRQAHKAKATSKGNG